MHIGLFVFSVFILCFIIHLDCSYFQQFNHIFTKLSFIWAPQGDWDREYVGCCVGGDGEGIITFILFTFILCSTLCQRMKISSCLEPSNLSQ